MSGGPPVKRVRFADSHAEMAASVAGDAGSGGRRQAGASTRHAVDSDDEELQEEQGDEADHGSGRLTDDNIEGQEEATIANDNGIAITPFNLREEMEEGYFDSAGCYIFKRDDREIHDNWLDNVDWDTVAHHQRPVQQRQGAAVAAASTVEGNADKDDDGSSDDDGEGELSPAELASVCTAARGLLGAGETVAAAIKRLGGGANRALTASQRLRLKKLGGGGGGGAAAAAGAEAAAAAAANRSRMLELSELAGRLVSAGHMAAYQMDAGQLARLGGVSDAEAAKVSVPVGPAGMDMFASDEEEHAAEEETSATSEKKNNKDQQVENKESSGVDADAEAGGVSWFYRVADCDTAEVLGPCSSRRMLEWSESEGGWPPGGHRQVFVRKADAPPDAPFYSSARIDFDLYV